MIVEPPPRAALASSSAAPRVSRAKSVEDGDSVSTSLSLQGAYAKLKAATRRGFFYGE